MTLDKNKRITGHAVVKMSGKELTLIVNSLKTIINKVNNRKEDTVGYSQLLTDFEKIKAEYDKKEEEANTAKRPRRK